MGCYTMKAGTEYELFVKEIYEAILKYEGVENIEVQHDIKIVGLSGVERQVDIFWEFKIAGVRYKLIIECKDYNTAVPLEKIDAFHSKVADIGGAIGVFVSKNRYQSGAIELARKYGIQLREIRVPNDKDWEGRVRDIEIHIHAQFVENVRPVFQVDSKWAKSNNFHSTRSSGMTDETFIENNIDGSSTSMLSIINKLSRETTGTNIRKEFVYDDAYLCFGDNRIKINKLILEYDVTESIEIVKICGDELIKAIVHDVIEGGTSSIHFDGSIVRRD